MKLSDKEAVAHVQFKQIRNTKHELNLVKAVHFLGMEDLLNSSSVLVGITFLRGVTIKYIYKPQC